MKDKILKGCGMVSLVTFGFFILLGLIGMCGR